MSDRAQKAQEYAENAEKKSHRAAWLDGGNRCALKQSEWIDGWWVGESPRNGEGALVEGPWQDWVILAYAILAYDEKIRAGEATVGIVEA